MYKQYIEKIDLSLEQGTENVPADKLYHVLHNGEVIYSHKNFKQALKQFNDLKADYSRNIETKKTEANSKELISKEISYQTTYAKEQYWNASHKYRKGKPKR